MSFAGTNYLAIVLAAVIGWLAGAVWYMALGKIWMAALGTTREEMEQTKRRPGALLPFIYAFVAELVMAWVLAGLLGHLGGVLLARFRAHDDARQQQLRPARLAPAVDRQRPLAHRAAADGRDHRRHGGAVKEQAKSAVGAVNR
jgi:hypothetical protein